MAEMFPALCPLCGAPTSLGSIECSKCGERLTGNPNLTTNVEELRQELKELHDSRKKQHRLSFAFGLPGLALQFGSGFIAGMDDSGVALALLARLVGAVLLIIGIGYSAAYKGRSPIWAVVGVLGCLGLIVVAVLKDLKKAQIKEIENALAGAPGFA